MADEWEDGHPLPHGASLSMERPNLKSSGQRCPIHAPLCLPPPPPNCPGGRVPPRPQHSTEAPRRWPTSPPTSRRPGRGLGTARSSTPCWTFSRWRSTSSSTAASAAFRPTRSACVWSGRCGTSGSRPTPRAWRSRHMCETYSYFVVQCWCVFSRCQCVRAYMCMCARVCRCVRGWVGVCLRCICPQTPNIEPMWVASTYSGIYLHGLDGYYAKVPQFPSPCAILLQTDLIHVPETSPQIIDA